MMFLCDPIVFLGGTIVRSDGKIQMRYLCEGRGFSGLCRLELIDGAFLARFHLVSLAASGRDDRPKFGTGDQDGLMLWWP
jgi:hypothetical protein